METYLNLSGHSGVRNYSIGPDYIDVLFSDGGVYRYTYASAGSAAIENMKRLAEAGRGLSSYISRYVRKQYAAKLR